MVEKQNLHAEQSTCPSPQAYRSSKTRMQKKTSKFFMISLLLWTPAVHIATNTQQLTHVLVRRNHLFFNPRTRQCQMHWVWETSVWKIKIHTQRHHHCHRPPTLSRFHSHCTWQATIPIAINKFHVRHRRNRFEKFNSTLCTLYTTNSEVSTLSPSYTRILKWT